MGSANTPKTLEWQIMRAVDSGEPTLLYRVAPHLFAGVPLSRPGYPVAVAAYILGTYGAGVPLNGLVVDQIGLAYPLGSHLLPTRRRPGHTKFVPSLWIVAEYSDVTKAPGNNHRADYRRSPGALPRPAGRARSGHPCPADSRPFRLALLPLAEHDHVRCLSRPVCRGEEAEKKLCGPRA